MIEKGAKNEVETRLAARMDFSWIVSRFGIIFGGKIIPKTIQNGIEKSDGIKNARRGAKN